MILGGDSLRHKLDSISDTVTDNVRETGEIMMTMCDDDACYTWLHGLSLVSLHYFIRLVNLFHWLENS